LLAIHPETRTVYLAQSLWDTDYKGLEGRTIARPAKGWPPPLHEVLYERWREFQKNAASLSAGGRL
jgi:hypothetical protein